MTHRDWHTDCTISKCIAFHNIPVMGRGELGDWSAVATWDRTATWHFGPFKDDQGPTSSIRIELQRVSMHQGWIKTLYNWHLFHDQYLKFESWKHLKTQAAGMPHLPLESWSLVRHHPSARARARRVGTRLARDWTRWADASRRWTRHDASRAVGLVHQTRFPDSRINI